MVKWHTLRQAICVIFFVAVTLSVNFAGADPTVYKNYGRISVGANQPTGDLEDAGYDPGFHLRGAYGRYLNRFLVVEGAIGIFSTDQEFSGRTETAGNYERDDFISVSALLGTIKAELPIDRLTLYAGAGVGSYGVALDSEIDTNRLGTFDVDDSDSVFGTHIVFGGHYDITPRVFIGIEALYRWTDDIKLDETVGTVPVTVKGDLNGYTIGVSGGFRF